MDVAAWDDRVCVCVCPLHFLIPHSMAHMEVKVVMVVVLAAASGSLATLRSQKSLPDSRKYRQMMIGSLSIHSDYVEFKSYCP